MCDSIINACHVIFSVSFIICYVVLILTSKRGKSYRLVHTDDGDGDTLLGDGSSSGSAHTRSHASSGAGSPTRAREGGEAFHMLDLGGNDDSDGDGDSDGVLGGDLSNARLLRAPPAEDVVAATISPASIAPMFILTSSPFAGMYVKHF